MREIPASNAHVAHQISHQPKHAALLTKVIDDALRSRAHSQARIDSKSDLIDPLRLEALLKHLQQQAPHVRRLLQTP
jgi:hypothetical protein